MATPIWFEGFEDQSMDYLTSAGWVFEDGVVLTGSNRHLDFAGNGGLKCLVTSDSDTVNLPTWLPGTGARWMTFYMMFQSLGSDRFFTFQRGGTNTWTVGIEAGYVTLRRGGSTSTLVTSSISPVVANVGHLWEIELLAQDVTGTCKVYVDKDTTPIVSFTGDTKSHTSLNDWNGGAIVATSFGSTFAYWDDFVVSDTRLSDEPYVIRLPPTSDYSIQSTGSLGGTGSFSLVDELPPTSSDYNQFPLNTRDLYGHDPLSFTPTSIAAIKVVGDVARDGTVTAIQFAVMSSGSEFFAVSQSIAGSGQYAMQESYWAVDPFTSSSWTVSGVNDTKFGAKFV